MSESMNRTVTFEPPVKGNNPNALASARFTIEPPINVHNPNFLDNAVKGLGWDNKSGDFPIISAVDLSFSDDVGTYGKVKFRASTGSEEFRNLVERSFEPELSLGGEAVKFVFRSEA